MHEIECLYDSSYESSPIQALLSPPDVFAVCAYFVKITGSYIAYAKASSALRISVNEAVEEGRLWRAKLDEKAVPNPKNFPKKILEAWGYVGSHITAPLAQLIQDEDFVFSCLRLIVACDQACEGVGIPSGPSKSYFELTSEVRIGSGTLCRFVPSDSVRVLPKQHTPQSGFNVRSLTHHLALCTSSEVEPVWTQMPHQNGSRTSYNLLLAPWPLQMDASDLMPAARISGQSERFGYFDYAPRGRGSVVPVKNWLEKLIKQSNSIGQNIDLIVFPECALTIKQWEAVSKIARKYGVSVVSGVRHDVDNDGFGQNSLRFKAPYQWQSEEVQYKHHRWQIEESQIANYGLGGTLDRRKAWWENIRIESRKVNFFAIRPELVICPLICEDLARQDPVAELVRSVGPNLVIALLMDGPQISHRWSARYATVLADDPGSSVLTISGLGMVQLSKPRGCKPSRVFASWKDAFGDFIPLELSSDETAMILNLQFREQEECSIDGRRDGGVATTPVLCGIHPLTVGGN